uniref:CST complex subunit CTC1 n=1 Tax=Strongyloides venezuelensis TaxID=75913 RepID=A0A0K0FEZ3_STRVS
MTDIAPSTVNFLKLAIESNDTNVNNYAVLIKLPIDINDGFECIDNYSILKRTKIKEISDKFLQQVVKYGKIFIYVDKIKINIRFDFIKNEFHKELEILDYSVCENDIFILNKNLEVLNTAMCDINDISYDAAEDEKDLSNVYNDYTNITYDINVLILEKSNLNKRKVSEEYTFNILIADYCCNVMKCICFNTTSPDLLYNKIETGRFYTMKLIEARTFTTKSNLKNFTTFDKGIILLHNSTVFYPTEKQFSFQYPNMLLEELNTVFECENDGQVNVVGIIAKIEDVVTHSNEAINVFTSRRVIFITNGEVIIPVYVYGELAYFNFIIGNLIGIRFGLVKPHLVCSKIITCNKTSYLVEVDNEEYYELYNKATKMEFDSMVFPDLSLIPSISEIIISGKYLMHIRNTPVFKIEMQKFYTMAKISFFGTLQKSKDNQKDYGPYLRVTLCDALVNIQHVTIFANKLSKIVPDLSGQLNRLMEDGTDLNIYLKEILLKPMVFRIKIDNFISFTSGGTPNALPNKIIDYLEFCPYDIYYQWNQRMRMDIIELININNSNILDNVISNNE